MICITSRSVNLRVIVSTLRSNLITSYIYFIRVSDICVNIGFDIYNCEIKQNENDMLYFCSYLRRNLMNQWKTFVSIINILNKCDKTSWPKKGIWFVSFHIIWPEKNRARFICMELINVLIFLNFILKCYASHVRFINAYSTESLIPNFFFQYVSFAVLFSL